MATVAELIESPDYFAYKFNFEQETIEFVALAESGLSRATWLNRESVGTDTAPITVPLAQLINVINTTPGSAGAASTRFIFHTAYCGSTFLSRCLDVADASVSLREPQLLLDAANAKRLQWQSKSTNMDYRHWPALAMRLLGKHASAQQTLIIKPINSVNNIIPELLQISQNAKAIMLYTDARNFLMSTLRKGEEARQTVRSMFDLLRCDFPHLAQLGLSDVLHMSDLKLTLTLWRLQLEQAEQMLAHFVPQTRMASLCGEHLIDEPIAALQAVNQFFDLGWSDETVSSVGQSDLAQQDAKDSSRGFSAAKRAQAYQQVEAFFGSDIENGLRWLTNNNPATSLSPTLSGSLL